MGIAPLTAAVRRGPVHWMFGVPTTPRDSGVPLDGGTGDTIGLTVEIFINNAWTDISPYVFYRGNERVVITRGRPNETVRLQPQTCTFTINNRDGRFSPRNPTGPYYGQIGRNTPVRVSRMQNGIRRFRFYGEIPSWPTKWDISGTDVYATITAAGQMRRLVQGAQPLGSMAYRVLALGTLAAAGLQRPVAYWPCEDGANSTTISSGFSGGSPMLLSGATPPTFATNNTFACSNPLPQLSGSIWTGLVPAYTGGVDNAMRLLLSVPAGGDTDGAVVASLYSAGTVARWDLQYTTAGNGSLRMVAYDASNNQLFFTAYVAPGTGLGFSGCNGRPLLISVNLTSAPPNINFSLTYLAAGFTNAPGGGYVLWSSTLNTASIGNATGVTVNPNGSLTSTAVGHVHVQKVADDITLYLGTLNAASGESPSARFSRLCSEQSVSGVVTGAGLAPADPTTMGNQLSDTFPNLIQQTPDTSLGLLFESREQLALVLRTRTSLYNQTAKLTLDHSANQLSGSLDPLDDDALTRNDVTTSRIGGSSNRQTLMTGALSTAPPPLGVGPYPSSPGISLGSDTLLPDQTGYRLRLGTVDQPRYPAIPVNLRYPAFTSNLDLLNAALTIDIGDRLVVANPPPWMPPDQISQIVQGYSEIMGVFEHDVTFNCSPEDPWRIGILDDGVLGHLDTDGSTLTLPAGATDTTLTVATTNASSPLWTTNAGDFPFDINIGGERITVQNITGASSPQTFSPVVRSVNGVVKSQLANADVRLWQPMYLSL